MTRTCIVDECTNQTNSPGGICAPCELRIKGGDDTLSTTPPESSDPVKKKGVKICKKCGEEFKPTGNRQKFCSSCAHPATKSRIKKVDTKPTKKKADKPTPKKTTEKQPKATEPVIKPNPEYKSARAELMLEAPIVLDLREYPAIEAWITKQADEEFRTPQLQIISILDSTMRSGS